MGFGRLEEVVARMEDDVQPSRRGRQPEEEVATGVLAGITDRRVGQRRD